MNYIKLINGFWIANIEHSFTGNETKLYFFLLSISNSLGWKNPFRQSDNQISLRAGISVNSVKSSRNRLSQAGLISFKTGSRGNRFNVKNKCEYKLLSLSAPSTVPPSKNDYDTVDDKVDDKVYDTVDDKGDGQGDINKLNKAKQELEKNKQKNILGVYQNFFDEVLKFFSLVSEQHQRNAFGYLARKIDKDEIKDFAEQTKAMMLYKKQNPKEKRSNWNNYIYDYDSGNSTDWVGKVKPVATKRITPWQGNPYKNTFMGIKELPNKNNFQP